MLAGMPSPSLAFSTVLTAAPSETRGIRVEENHFHRRHWWLIANDGLFKLDQYSRKRRPLAECECRRTQGHLVISC